MTELHETLRRCRSSIERFRPQAKKIGEQNTKASLIEPIIAVLGWDTIDPDEVHREYRRRGADNPVDYALLLRRTPRLFVEAKGLGENIDDHKWTNQTISYAAVAGVEWVALTDGDDWRIYNAHAPVPAEQKLFRRVRLTGDIDEAAEVLSLLSKENMAENRIEALWKSYFVDRQVHGVLEELFGGSVPPNDLVNLVRKRAGGLTPKEVRESLGRVDARFDFPVVQSAATPAAGPGPRVAPPVPGARPGGAPVRPVPPTPKGRKPAGRSAAQTSIKLADLVAAGVLRPGTPLYTTYDGFSYEATIESDGSVGFDGQRYRSPSGAGRAVKRSVRGEDTPESTISTDGYSFWSVRMPAGEYLTLQELRVRLAEGRL